MGPFVPFVDDADLILSFVFLKHRAYTRHGTPPKWRLSIVPFM